VSQVKGMRPWWPLGLGCLCAWAGPAVGREELPAIFVSASGLSLSARDVSQHVSVYTRDQLESEAPASLAEFLARRAGVVVDRGARSGGYGALYLRGADPSHVVVLIDGLRQNDPLSSRGSAVDLNSLTLDDVERIEIVRGNNSVAQGESIAGTVQIFTRHAASRAAAEIGGGGLRSASASLAGAGAYASVADREDGERAGTGWSRTRAFDAGWETHSDTTSLRAQLRASDADGIGFPDDSGGPDFAVLREREQRAARARQIAATAGHTMAGFGRIEATLDAYSRDSDDVSPGVAPGVRDDFGLPPQTSHGNYLRRSLDLRWLSPHWSGWDFLVGAQRQEEAGTLDGQLFLGAWVPTHFRIDRDTNALIGEARTVRGPLNLQFGWRDEHTPGKPAVRHPAASFGYALPAEAGQVGAAWSSASKLPSFYALGDPFVGNPALKPERSRQQEIFYATPADAAWSARLTGFRADYSDLVDFDAGPPPRLINRARIRSSGVEFDLSGEIGHGLRVYANGTRMQVRDPAGGPPLRYRPREQGNAGLSAELSGGWQWHVGMSYVGRRYDSSVPTGDVWLDGYAAIDTAFSWRSGPWQLTFALDNAFDHRIEETIGTQAGGRRLRVGLRWSP